MAIYFFDHAYALEDLHDLLDNVATNETNGPLRSLDQDIPDACNVDDWSLLVIHTQNPSIWIDWARQKQNVKVILVSRDPPLIIQPVDDASLRNCICWRNHVGNGHLDQKEFECFIIRLIQLEADDSCQEIYKKYKSRLKYPEYTVAAYLLMIAKARKIDVVQDRPDDDFWSNVSKELKYRELIGDHNYPEEQTPLPNDWESFNNLEGKDINTVLQLLKQSFQTPR